MKKLILTTLTVSAVLMNCAPKENNVNNTTTTRPQRGSLINGQPAMPGQQGLQRSGGTQQQQVVQTGELVNLERFSKDLGFLSVNDKKIPQVVRQASASVFHLVMFTASAGDSSYSVQKKSEVQKREKEARANINKADGYNSFEKRGLHEQITACLKYAKDDENCVLMNSVVHASAFLLGDGSTLMTNGHVIEEYLKSLMALEKKTLAEVTDKSNKLLIFIFNQENKLVFNPYDHQVHIETMPIATTASSQSERFYGVDNDYVQLKLSYEIGNPLTWSAKGAEVNRTAFALGYPDCTGCEIREKNPAEDKVLTYTNRSPAPNVTKEFQVAATKGNVIFADDTVLGFYKMSPQERTLIQKNIVFYTGDSQHGMSGGPILNEKGEVIAIMSAGRSRKIKDRFYRLSNGVVPPKYLVE